MTSPKNNQQQPPADLLCVSQPVSHCLLHPLAWPGLAREDPRKTSKNINKSVFRLLNNRLNVFLSQAVAHRFDWTMSGLFPTPSPAPNLPAKSSGFGPVHFVWIFVRWFVFLLVRFFFPFKFARPNRFFLLTHFHKSRKFEAKVHLKATSFCKAWLAGTTTTVSVDDWRFSTSKRVFVFPSSFFFASVFPAFPKSGPGSFVRLGFQFGRVWAVSVSSSFFCWWVMGWENKKIRPSVSNGREKPTGSKYKVPSMLLTMGLGMEGKTEVLALFGLVSEIAIFYWLANKEDLIAATNCAVLWARRWMKGW